MRRYWIEPECFGENHVELTGDLFHHIFDVCRQELGSKFEVLHSGQAFFVQVIDVKKRSATAKILEQRELPTLPKPYLHLALCIPRFQVLENVLEKAVELGIHSLQLISSDYSFVKKSEKISPAKWERWQKIIRSSTQQTGRGDLMTLQEPISLQEFAHQMNQKGSSLCLFGYEGPTTVPLEEHLVKIKNSALLEDAWILVGAEGGFSTQEVTQLVDSQITPVSLGPQILRVETACITLTSILKYELGLMKGRYEI